MISQQLEMTLEALSSASHIGSIKGIKRGIEREALRTNVSGHLSQTDHPVGAGSALTNRYITTDFSESLLEYITPVSTSAEETLAQLSDLQKFTLSQMGDEVMWPASMPCYITDEEEIRIACYGHSNSGKMKSLYRLGLKNRYGSMMQAIAGVHFNLSFPESFWRSLAAINGDERPLQAYISDGYLGLIRNFKRELWLISYLFGASPALCASFLKDEKRREEFARHGKGTLYLPYGTALRLGDLGYTNSAQSALRVMYNSLDEYVAGLKSAINTRSELYQHLDDYRAESPQQLNKNILQIENEFYSPIRPKRNGHSGETPSESLLRGGIEYIEVRALDVNPFADTGIDLMQIRFLDVFLTACLLKGSPAMSWQEQCQSQSNLQRVVNEGRRPGLTLQRGGEEVSLKRWGEEIFSELRKVASYMDSAYGGNAYLGSINELAAWLEDPEQTLSGRYLGAMLSSGKDNGVYSLELGRKYKAELTEKPFEHFTRDELEQEAKESFERQKQIEEADQVSFTAFLDAYFKQ